MNISIEAQLKAFAREGNLARVKELCDTDAGKALHRIWKDDALEASAKGGHLSVVRYLVESSGADPYTEVGEGALFEASSGGHISIVQYLIELPPPEEPYISCVAVSDDEDGEGQEDDEDDFDETYRYEHYRKQWIDRAVYEASKSGHLSVVKYLVENGASITMCTHTKSISILQYLLDKEIQTKYLNEALLWVSGNCEDVKVAIFLLDHGANIHAVEDTPLLMLDESENKAYVYKDALYIAMEKANKKLIKLLIERGARATPAHKRARYNYMTIGEGADAR